MLVIILSFSLIFRKRIMLTYDIIQKYLSLKDEITNVQNYVDISPIEDAITYKDVVYKSTNGVNLTLDIYSPKEKIYKKSPVILYVHGGSWVYGDKTIPKSISPILETFREEGYTIISTSYELMRNTENFNKQVCDVKDSIRWLYKNSEEYNIDTDEIGVLGFSSGAHLSLLASYSSNDKFTDDPALKDYSSKVKYIVDFSGPTDLNLLDTSNLNFDLNKVFSSIKNRDKIIEDFNPINYATKDDPSTLIIHSRGDSVVPFASSEKLYAKTKEVNSKSTFVALNSSDHDLSNISNDDIIAMSKGLFLFVVLNSPL